MSTQRYGHATNFGVRVESRSRLQAAEALPASVTSRPPPWLQRSGQLTIRDTTLNHRGGGDRGATIRCTPKVNQGYLGSDQHIPLGSGLASNPDLHVSDLTRARIPWGRSQNDLRFEEKAGCGTFEIPTAPMPKRLQNISLLMKKNRDARSIEDCTNIRETRNERTPHIIPESPCRKARMDPYDMSVRHPSGQWGKQHTSWTRRNNVIHIPFA